MPLSKRGFWSQRRCLLKLSPYCICAMLGYHSNLSRSVNEYIHRRSKIKLKMTYISFVHVEYGLPEYLAPRLSMRSRAARLVFSTSVGLLNSRRKTRSPRTVEDQ